MNKKFCKQCVKEGKKSTIYIPQYGISTLMSISPAYYDEDGNYHFIEDPNITTYNYSCSNGHSWVETI